MLGGGWGGEVRGWRRGERLDGQRNYTVISASGDEKQTQRGVLTLVCCHPPLLIGRLDIHIIIMLTVQIHQLESYNVIPLFVENPLY